MKLRSLFPVLVYLFVCLTGCAAAHPKDRWFNEDKLQHFLISGTGAAYMANELSSDSRAECEALAISMGIVFVLGLGKEWLDENVFNRYWSKRDIVWNMIGASVGSIAVTHC